MIAVRTIATEHVNFEALLERFEIINFRPHDLPKRFDVALQWFGFKQRWPKVPRIFTEGGRFWPAPLAFAMNMRWLDGQPLTDLIKRDVVSVNAQRRAEVEVVRLVRLFAIETTQPAEHLWIVEVSHRHTITLSRVTLRPNLGNMVVQISLHLRGESGEARRLDRGVRRSAQFLKPSFGRLSSGQYRSCHSIQYAISS